MLVKKYNRQNATIADIFAEYVAKQPEKVCLIFEDRKWTFREVSWRLLRLCDYFDWSIPYNQYPIEQVNDYSNRVANVFLNNKYKRGEVVGLMLENRPEFVAMWLGLSKLGVIVPLINHNLRKNALLHSVNVANCKALIYGESLRDAVQEIKESLPSSLELFQFNDAVQQPVLDIAHDLASMLQNASKEQPTANVNKPDHHDKLLYIYTSGTTGLPKAAVITHSRYRFLKQDYKTLWLTKSTLFRFVFITAAIHMVAGFRNDDIFYTPLPLYHTAGGMMSIGQALLFGATVVIRKKFSASQYFADCKKNNCTVDSDFEIHAVDYS